MYLRVFNTTSQESTKWLQQNTYYLAPATNFIIRIISDSQINKKGEKSRHFEIKITMPLLTLVFH